MTAIVQFQTVKTQLEEWESSKSSKSKSATNTDDHFETFECPFKIWETNPIFPPLSDSIQIAYDEEVSLADHD